MDFFADSLFSAIRLAASGDPELYGIVLVSLTVSGASTLLSATLGVPLGFWLAFSRSGTRGVLATVFQTLLALPTVVVGLFVYAFISRRGIFGPLDLLYTKTAIVIGQTILVTPVVAVFTMAAVARTDERYAITAKTLGANRYQTALVILHEARLGVLAAILAAFGRVIAEVGVSMMLGGNIKGYTRTMTTAMALEYDKGQFVLAVALGVLLLAIAFGLNIALQIIRRRSGA